MFVIQALGRQKQGNHSNFKSSLGYMVRWSQKQKGEAVRRREEPVDTVAAGAVSSPTISRGGGLHYTCLLAWHRRPRTADQKVKLGTPAGIGANFVMLVKIDLPRVHHFPVERQDENCVRTAFRRGPSADFMVEIREAQYLTSQN